MVMTMLLQEACQFQEKPEMRAISRMNGNGVRKIF